MLVTAVVDDVYESARPTLLVPVVEIEPAETTTPVPAVMGSVKSSPSFTDADIMSASVVVITPMPECLCFPLAQNGHTCSSLVDAVACARGVQHRWLAQDALVHQSLDKQMFPSAFFGEHLESAMA